MVIKNRNGEFQINSSHYNWLIHNIPFNEINGEIISKTIFINSSWEYKKADEIKETLLKLI